MAPGSTTLPTLAMLTADPLAGADCPAKHAGVEVEVLEDEVAHRDAGPVRVTTLRVVTPLPPAPGRGERSRAGIAVLIGAKDWDQIRITVVDGHTVRIGCGRTAIRRTYRDLGLFAENSREPTKKWAMLLAICAGHGEFRWRDFGEFGAARQAVSVLRGKLRDAFGLEGDPFHAWSNGWRARFFASSEVGEGEE